MSTIRQALQVAIDEEPYGTISWYSGNYINSAGEEFPFTAAVSRDSNLNGTVDVTVTWGENPEAIPPDWKLAEEYIRSQFA